MRTAPESRKITTLLKSLREEALLPTPDFQRRAVWTNKDKIAFIETILLGYPFPEIYVASGDVDTATGEATEFLVDGQQRVRTIDEYFRGVKPFSRTQAVTRYTQLTDPQKRDFLNYDVSVRNLGIVEMDQIRAIFRRMNLTSYDLNDMERYNAVYLGQFKQFSERVAQDEFFAEHRVFSAADIRRMKDVSFVASLTATILSDYFHRDEEIETYLQQYDEMFKAADEAEARYRSAFGTLDTMGFERDSRAWKKADFYTLFVEVDRLVSRDGRDLDAAAAGARLKEFFADVEAARHQESVTNSLVADYYRATLQNTNDRATRAARGRIIRQVLLDM